MSTIGLIMAGGAGTRMERSGGSCPKPLVTVRGRSLLEHNVRAMVRAGIEHIVVSVRKNANDVRDFTLMQCRPTVVALGGSLEVLVEEHPLGNIGCLGLLRGQADTVVVTYADNLTALSPADVLSQHAERSPALTLAAHWHPFQMPFGELKLDGCRISAYTEKPVTKSLVCSAICVAGREALNALPDDKPTGLSQLASMLIERGQLVEAYEHAAPWIDVNDTAAASRAEELIESHMSEFEWFIEANTQTKAA